MLVGASKKSIIQALSWGYELMQISNYTLFNPGSGNLVDNNDWMLSNVMRAATAILCTLDAVFNQRPDDGLLIRCCRTFMAIFACTTLLQKDSAPLSNHYPLCYFSPG